MAFPFVGGRAGGIAEARLVHSPGVRRIRLAVRMACARARLPDGVRFAVRQRRVRAACGTVKAGVVDGPAVAAREELRVAREEAARSTTTTHP